MITLALSASSQPDSSVSLLEVAWALSVTSATASTCFLGQDLVVVFTPFLLFPFLSLHKLGLIVYPFWFLTAALFTCSQVGAAVFSKSRKASDSVTQSESTVLTSITLSPFDLSGRFEQMYAFCGRVPRVSPWSRSQEIIQGVPLSCLWTKSLFG